MTYPSYESEASYFQFPHGSTTRLTHPLQSQHGVPQTLLVMFDKHLLGLPLLGDSLCHSPRVPPKFTISGRRQNEHVTRKKPSTHFERGSDDNPEQELASFNASSVKYCSADSAIFQSKPSQMPLIRLEPLPVATRATTGISIYQPLEAQQSESHNQARPHCSRVLFETSPSNIILG